MLKTTTCLSETKEQPVAIINIKNLSTGDFEINQGNVMDININNTSINESLFAVLDYIFKEKGSSSVFIKTNEFLFDMDLAIQMYLLSYKFMKLNIIIETKETNIFDSIKEALSKILEIKKTFCNNDSELLKKSLLAMYPLFSDVTKKIIDNTYPKEEVDFKGKYVTIIDNHNFFYRNFHGMPDMRDSNGRPTSIIKALTTLIKEIEIDNPDFVIFANEGTSLKNIRKDISSSYKENRNPTPPDLKIQIPICLELLQKMNFKIVEKEGFEADDIISSYAKAFSDAGAYVKVITTDKDLYQIKAEDNNISIYDPNKKEYITEQHCIQKFGVTFNKCQMVQAIMGDTSDNVPGIKGIGVKTAAELINQYGNLENLYKNIEAIPGKKGEKIKEGKQDAFTSLKLVTLYDDLAEEDIMSSCFKPENPLLKISKELSSFEINIL